MRDDHSCVSKTDQLVREAKERFVLVPDLLELRDELQIRERVSPMEEGPLPPRALLAMLLFRRGLLNER